MTTYIKYEKPALKRIAVDFNANVTHEITNKIYQSFHSL